MQVIKGLDTRGGGKSDTDSRRFEDSVGGRQPVQRARMSRVFHAANPWPAVAGRVRGETTMSAGRWVDGGREGRGWRSGSRGRDVVGVSGDSLRGRLMRRSTDMGAVGIGLNR